MVECCKATICSECFLQLQDCRISNPCPFCNCEIMVVKVAKRLEEEEVQRREKEEQHFIEASIKARHCSSSGGIGIGGSNISGGDVCTEHGNPKEVLQGSSFGSNLNADLEKRCRTFSADLHQGTNKIGTSTNTGEAVVAVTPEERRKLEEEMSSHNLHPLLQQMTAEAERERERHELEYRQRRRDRSRNTRMRMEQLMGRGFSSGGNIARRTPTVPARDNLASLAERVSLFAGVSAEPARVPAEIEVDGRPTIDDLLLFEAALFLSMREESSRRNGNGDTTDSSRSNNGSRRSSGGQGIDGGNPNSQRARTRGFLSRRRNTVTRDANANVNRDEDPVTRRHREARSFVQALLHQREFEQRPNPFIGYSGRDDGGLSPRESLLADLSEARQLEMAIQLSLQEAQGGGGDTAEADANADDDSRNNDNDDDLVLDDQADHGEEEVVFDHQEDEIGDAVVEPASSSNTTSASVDNSLPPVNENAGGNANVVGENEAVPS